MIPALAYMIAAYGTARLINDFLSDRHEMDGVKVLMFAASFAAILTLWYLAQHINSMGADVGTGILDSLR